MFEHIPQPTILKARAICSRGRARKAVIMVVVSSLVYNISRFFEYKYQGKGVVAPTNLRLNETYKIAYMTVKRFSIKVFLRYPAVFSILSRHLGIFPALAFIGEKGKKNF